MAIDDAAAFRRQQAVIDPVVVGEQGVVVGVEHLQVVEPPGQRSEERQLATAEQQRPAGEHPRAFRVTQHGAAAAPGCGPA